MTRIFRLTAAALSLPLIVLTAAGPGTASRSFEWTAPENLGPAINSAFQEFGPAISRNGLSLYFTSNRPGGLGDMDLWVSQRAAPGDEWGPPVNLGPGINTEASDNVPAFSPDGHWLFFNSTREGGFGLQDIWASWRKNVNDDFGWESPVNLGPGVNTAMVDVNASILEHQREWAPLLFFTSNRFGLAGFDVYVSQLTPKGVFGPATLVPELSSQSQEQRPSIRSDALEIFFHSDRPGSAGIDLWVSTRESTEMPWSVPVNMGAIINTASSDQQPYLARDRRTLFLASDRPGGLGALDLYVASRRGSDR